MEFKKVYVEGEGHYDIKVLCKSPNPSYSDEYVYFLEVFDIESNVYGYPAYTSRQIKNLFNIDLSSEVI